MFSDSAHTDMLAEVERSLQSAFGSEKNLDSFIVAFTNFKDSEKFKEILKNKCDQLRRRKKLIENQNGLIEEYGHKNPSFSLTSDDDEPKLLFLYCVAVLCIYGWQKNKVSTNDTIGNLVVVLKHLEKNNKEQYNLLISLLSKSEIPDPINNEYSKIFCCTLQSFEIFTGKLKNKELCLEDLFSKTEGLDFGKGPFSNDSGHPVKLPSDKSLLELANDVRSGEYLSKPELTAQDIKEITVKEMFWRHQAIFIMLFFEVHGSMRLRYSREAERISNSEFSQYLQYKTQVMSNNASDEQRTRLTHSHDVARIAQVISKQLGCNWELAEAISLGHDLGHTPFGHGGEETLDECLHKAWAGRFLHSLQSAKVIEQLAKSANIYTKFGISGLCLSCPVTEGVLKHDTDNFFNDIRRVSWLLQYDGWRGILARKEEGADGKDPEWKKGLCIGGLESQIVYWSDKIAYSGHDWHDFAQSGLIYDMARKIEDILQRMHQLRHMVHGRNGIRTKPSEKIRTEIDIVRFIRYHLEEIRKKLLPEEVLSKTDEQKIVDAFAPERLKARDKEFKASNNVSRADFAVGKKFSPLAQFVFEYSAVKEEIIDEPGSRDWSLKYFTKAEYTMLFDFFRVAHEMIYLTLIFPKPYKKSNEVIWILEHYLADEMNYRTVVHALRSDIIRHSRGGLSNYLVESSVLEKGREAMDKTINDVPKYDKNSPFGTVRTLREAMAEMGKVGLFESVEEARAKGRPILKKWFKENFQREMLIRLSEEIIPVQNNIADFVHEYYIKSDRVRFMRYKANEIVRTLFSFFMEHEDMLPTEHRHRIESEAQKLYAADYENPLGHGSKVPKPLVIKYLHERLEEAKKQGNKAVPRLRDFENMTTKAIINHCVKSEICPPDVQEFLKILQEKGSRDIRTHKSEFFVLCKHIAKARVIADYIATMTDRYAEKKYNEIKTSGTVWSTSFQS